MPKKGFKSTTIGNIEYKLAEKLAVKDRRSVKGIVELLIIREAQKEGLL